MDQGSEELLSVPVLRAQPGLEDANAAIIRVSADFYDVFPRQLEIQKTTNTHTQPSSSETLSSSTQVNTLSDIFNLFECSSE